METHSDSTRERYYEILGNEQSLSPDEARVLFAGIEGALCHEDPVEAAGDRWYFYGRFKEIAESRRDEYKGSEGAGLGEIFERATWEEIFQSASAKLKDISRKPLTDDLVDELFLNRMWQWKPVDALLLERSMPGKFFHAGEIAKLHYIIREVARTCRDAAEGVLREEWEVVCRSLGIEDKDGPLPSG